MEQSNEVKECLLAHYLPLMVNNMPLIQIQIMDLYTSNSSAYTDYSKNKENKVGFTAVFPDSTKRGFLC